MFLAIHPLQNPCVTTEHPDLCNNRKTFLVSFHFPNDIKFSGKKHNHSSGKNFKVTMQVKQMPFSLFLLVLRLLVLLRFFLPIYRTSLVESMAKQYHELWLRS